ncbi:GntR family transcriptional regulator [Lysinibacillus piscis]|uniref:HTH-type transcriptional regulator GmuR n=1 Tax=Lysinibacillus piscis TaxID=2518931 RepID=A0ABQ5NMN6_9BACI|nr:GntR family transcriptional regulator [Lysinibacillus sp. KH24]GLC89567.1 HTH-type transcriptional regulator GmuR [Lysinibacillus sp. KH24]
MAKYSDIANEMRRRIQRGEYDSNYPITDEVSLTKEFLCSRMTVKKALDILVAEGLLYRKRGHGTFIVKSAKEEKLVNVLNNENVGLTKLIGAEHVESVIIGFDIQFPSQEVAAHLSIDLQTPTYHIIRLRKWHGEPYVLERTYMPATIIKDLTKEILKGSIYDHITETLGLTIGGAHRKIRADKPGELDQEYLHCAANDPILEVEQVAYLNIGMPFEYSFSRHRYDKFVFKTVIIQR